MYKRTRHSRQAGEEPPRPVSHNDHPADGELWDDCRLCDFIRGNPEDAGAVYYRTTLRERSIARESLLRTLGVHRRPRPPRHVQIKPGASASVTR
jgi:hypothetical protein